jgi:hypothetical protein
MARPLLSPFASRFLFAHQFQGKSNDCGPYSAAIAIYALTGLFISGQQIAEDTNRRFISRQPPFLNRIPYNLTFPWGVGAIIKEYHCLAKWFFLYKEKNLIHEIQQPKVIIVIYGQWLPLWAHYAVLAAYHDKLGYGLINPSLPTAKIEWIPRRKFLLQWNSYGRMVIIAHKHPL